MLKKQNNMQTITAVIPAKNEDDLSKNVSVIISVYNEDAVIGNCLVSLKKQTIKPEIIVVDDGSTDRSASFAQFKQKHLGPGAARNLGASKAKGNILVFVDADMEFEPNFIEKLIEPINSFRDGKYIIGTFSKEEYLLNKENIWARCWNINLGRNAGRMHSDNYPNEQEVFRAIRKDYFNKAGGFDTMVGYTDDWTISRKLGIKAVFAPGAKYYHTNPASLKEVWTQARWFGKNEFLTKNLTRRLFNLFRYFPLWSVFSFYNINLLIFKLVYNAAVFTSVFLSFFGEQKAR